MSSLTGKLWIIATPLGNPGDLSPRAAAVLARADLILAEDTRRSGRLLADCGIAPRRFMSLHDHNEGGRVPELLEALRGGKEIALISDAGTPLVSDPGYRLVRAVREAGLPAAPLPGPCAPVAALSASGLPPVPFAFLGFAPRRAGERRAFFAPYAPLGITLIFFERKDRVAATLEAARAVLGEREVCLARELTKTHEEFIFFTLKELEASADVLRDLKGEVTVLLAAPPKKAAASETAGGELGDFTASGADGRLPEKELLTLLNKTRRAALQAGDEFKDKDLARAAAAKAPGWSVKDIYKLLQG